MDARYILIMIFAFMMLVIFMDEFAYNAWKQTNPGWMWTDTRGNPLAHTIVQRGDCVQCL